MPTEDQLAGAAFTGCFGSILGAFFGLGVGLVSFSITEAIGTMILTALLSGFVTSLFGAWLSR